MRAPHNVRAHEIMVKAEIRALAKALATESMGKARPQMIRRLEEKLKKARGKLSPDIVTSPLPTQEETGLGSQ